MFVTQHNSDQNLSVKLGVLTGNRLYLCTDKRNNGKYPGSKGQTSLCMFAGSSERAAVTEEACLWRRRDSN